MVNYMREGGVNMYAMLAIAIIAVGYAAARPLGERSGALRTGCVVLLMQGMLGMAMGMRAVSNKYASFPDKVEAIGLGLGELSNNGTFAATLFVVLGVAALITQRQAIRAGASRMA